MTYYIPSDPETEISLLNFAAPSISLPNLPALSSMAALIFLIRRLYLALYNCTLFIGWFQVLYLVLKTLKESGHEHVYSVAEKPMLFAQTAAVLEIFHSLVGGLVRSPVAVTLPQIASRLFLMWGIIWSCPETQTHVLVSSLLISFSITEAIRYAFYGMKEAFGFVPSWLLWLRYSTFFVMFITGIISEVGLMYRALPFIKETGKYSVRMPNKWNFSFDYSYAAIGVLGIYVPGVPHLFRHMLAQRKTALSKSKRE